MDVMAGWLIVEIDSLYDSLTSSSCSVIWFRLRPCLSRKLDSVDTIQGPPRACTTRHYRLDSSSKDASRAQGTIRTDELEKEALESGP